MTAKTAAPQQKYRVTLSDRERQFDLGVFEAKSTDEAIKRAKKTFSGLYKRLTLDEWATQAKPE